jgi:tetratricopeptide (TPR) repeat protein
LLDLATDDDAYWSFLASEDLFPLFPTPEGGRLEAVTDEAESPLSDLDQTVTLGNLYLEQGHLEEAATIFNRVIEVDPENREALEGLGRIRKDPAAELRAGDLLGEGDLSEANTAERKRKLLESYRKRLKGKGEGA